MSSPGCSDAEEDSSLYVETVEGLDSQPTTSTSRDPTEEVSTESVPGIVYLSSIPPFMKPHKLRHLLSQYGSVGRVYLQPEAEAIRQRRIRFKGNKKVRFTEGWVEFMDKRLAKSVARTLNCTHVGVKKRSMYHDDLWNMRYLPKFRWTHLTEKIAYQQAVRDQRMRTEISQAKKETTYYLANVEKHKEIAAIVERKKRKGVPEEQCTSVVQRQFKQRAVSEGTAVQRKSKLCTSLLKKVFA